MNPIQELMVECEMNTLDTGKIFFAYITHVNNPHSFYVRPQEYNRHMSGVQARGRPINKSEIKLDTIVIYKSKILKNYVRGKIICIAGEDDLKCQLFAIDYGCMENDVPIKNIWQPNYQENVPPLAFHCKLETCLPQLGNWHESTIEAMKSFVKKKAEVIIKNILPEVLIVELGNLARLLAVTRYSSNSHVDKVEDYKLHVLYWSMSCQRHIERVINVKSVFHVRFQSGSLHDKFYAAPIEEYIDFLNYRKDYTTFVQTVEDVRPHQLKLNAPVGVFNRHTNKYERGIVKRLYPNIKKAKVKLVDWGTIVEESIEIMRPLPSSFMSYPPIAICCRLHSSQYSMKSSSEISNMCNFACPGVEFCMTIEEMGVDNSPYLVTVSDIKYN